MGRPAEDYRLRSDDGRVMAAVKEAFGEKHEAGVEVRFGPRLREG
ncbi:MAG: hypothetical protein AAF447_07035 [Myxococcota bacterium]